MPVAPPQVKKRGDDRKYLARVLSIGIECDIALLAVDDEGFWEGVEPLQFGPLPRLQDSVAVVGYPVGGDTISITAGVVSRIEVRHWGVWGGAGLWVGVGVGCVSAVRAGAYCWSDRSVSTVSSEVARLL